MFRFFLICVLPACVSICYCEENDFPGGYFCNNHTGAHTKLLKIEIPISPYIFCCFIIFHIMKPRLRTFYFSLWLYGFIISHNKIESVILSVYVFAVSVSTFFSWWWVVFVHQYICTSQWMYSIVFISNCMLIYGSMWPCRCVYVRVCDFCFSQFISFNLYVLFLFFFRNPQYIDNSKFRRQWWWR